MFVSQSDWFHGDIFIKGREMMGMKGRDFGKYEMRKENCNYKYVWFTIEKKYLKLIYIWVILICVHI